MTLLKLTRNWVKWMIWVINQLKFVGHPSDIMADSTFSTFLWAAVTTKNTKVVKRDSLL